MQRRPQERDLVVMMQSADSQPRPFCELANFQSFEFHDEFLGRRPLK